MKAEDRSTTRAVVDEYYMTTAHRSHRAELGSYLDWSRTQGARLRGVLVADKSAKCVDLACGTGELLFHLQALGYTRVTGVDLSSDVLQAAKPFVRYAELVRADVIEFLEAQPPNSIGLLTAMNIVEHLPKADLVRFFSAVDRALAPGGQLIMTVPNAVSPFGTIPRYWDITHETSFSPNSIRQLFTAAGFSATPTFHEVGPVPHGVPSAVRFILWKLIRELIRLRLVIESGSARSDVFTMDMIVSGVKVK